MEQLGMGTLHQLFVGKLARIVARDGWMGFSQDASNRQKSWPPFAVDIEKGRRTLADYRA